MTNEFNVIGQRKDDDLHLLVRGDDGRHYDYSLASEQVSPVNPDERWVIDGTPADETPHAEDKTGDIPPEPDSEMPVR
jgi:hypothetical protein